jgi:hypothetical protein
MIKNLVTSGCSFTAGKKTWAQVVCDRLRIPNFYNVGSAGAGNRYIAQSVVDAVQHYCLDTSETLVLVMWSGAGRLDALVSGEYWYLLSDYYYKTKINDLGDNYWIHSGGRSNAWMDHHETKKIFQHQYIISDPCCCCKETLDNIRDLESYLQNHEILYKFMSYVNYWNDQQESTANGDFCIPTFTAHLPMYQQLNLRNWIFVNNQKDCIFEFCRDNSCISDDGFHPSLQGHELFVDTVMMSYLNKFKEQT